MFGPLMTSSQKFNFLAHFWDFTGYFAKNFSPKFSNSEKQEFRTLFSDSICQHSLDFPPNIAYL